MDYPTYNTPQAEAVPTGTYIALFHGRKDPKQTVEDWGFDGPVIGPLAYVHTTYASEIKIALAGKPDAEIVIPIVDGCAEFDGKFYGDWTVYQHTQRRVRDVPVDSDRRKG